MEVFFAGKVELHPGDCLDVMRELAANSIDACVTDPPYGLGREPDPLVMLRAWLDGGHYDVKSTSGFMGKEWDAFVPQPAIWKHVFRILKPGAHVLAFFGARTYDLGVLAMRLAGFEVRDSVQWLFGSGFPKSLDVSKAIDKARDDREYILRVSTFVADAAKRAGKDRSDIDAHMGTSDMAGWWTSRLLHRCQCPKWDQWLRLKAFLSFGDEMDAEVWRLNGRKGTPGLAWQSAEVIGFDRNWGEPSDSTPNAPNGEWDIKSANSDAAREWQGFGTALKPAYEPIVLARKPLSESTVAANVLKWGTGALNIDGSRVEGEKQVPWGKPSETRASDGWGMQEPDLESNGRNSAIGRWPANVIHDGSDEVVGAFPETFVAASSNKGGTSPNPMDWGKSRRDIGVGSESSGSAARFFYTAKADADDRLGSKHPTVKPLDLMQYLVRLVTPRGGVCLDPFAGTGTTGEAAFREGMRAILIEREPEYQTDIRRRMALVMSGSDERARESIKAKTKDKPIDHGPLFGPAPAKQEVLGI